MKELIRRIAKMRGAAEPPNGASAPQKPIMEPVAPERRLPPPELPLLFMLSHLEDDGPVRLDGVKIGVCEVMGLEIDEPKLGAFAGALNALDFPAQLLIRQHPPRLERDAGEACNRPNPKTCPRRRGRPPSRSGDCSPSWRPATASSTGASTPCASSSDPTSCTACWRELDCPSIS